MLVIIFINTEPRVVHFGNKIKVTLYIYIIFKEQDVLYMILYVLNNFVNYKYYKYTIIILTNKTIIIKVYSCLL